MPIKSSIISKDSGSLIIDGLQVANKAYNKGSVSGAVEINWNQGNTQVITLTGNTTLTFANAKLNSFYTLIVIQDGSGGHSLSFPATSKAGGGELALSDAVNAVNMVTIHVQSTGVYLLSSVEDFQSL